MEIDLHPTEQYANDIVNNGLVSCKYEYLACKRHLDDLKRSINDISWPYVFDETRADKMFEYFLYCRHVRGCFAGLPIELEPFQKFDIGCLFGWVHKKTGIRRFKTGYIREARGQGKSTLMSGIALFGMVGDSFYPPNKPQEAKYENKPEVVCIAVDRGQAEIVWGDARDMALQSPEIAKRLNIQKTKISHKTRGGDLRKLSKDTKNKDGGAPCIIIVDEYHDHPTSGVKDKTAYGKGKRSQSLEIIVTTAGEDAENKPCKKEDDIVKKILRGEIISDAYFGVIREIDDDDDPHDESVWVKSNPIFRVMNKYSQSIYDEMQNEHNLAFGSGDNSKIRQWMIKRVNRWQVDAENRYMSGCMTKWNALAISRTNFIEIIRGKECFVGLDLGKSSDLTAVSYVFPLENGKYAVSAHGYIPSVSVIKHEHSDRVPYRDWVKDGWCTITDGAVTDYNYIKTQLENNRRNYGLIYREICFDPYNATHFIQDLKNSGYSESELIEIRQGVLTLSAPTKYFRDLVLQGRIIHEGSPLLSWCLSNAVEIIDNNGNIKLSKKHKDDSQRIDLAAAVIFAMVRAMINEPDGTGRALFI